MPVDIGQHCAEIERCNQRGGRMLSIVDLIEAGTFSRDLAAYSLAAIGDGASFMVGALPGGAGKTTAMGALLNFVPRDVSLVAADGEAAELASARLRHHHTREMRSQKLTPSSIPITPKRSQPPPETRSDCIMA